MEVHKGIDVPKAGKFKGVTGTPAVVNAAHPAEANTRHGHQRQRPKPTDEAHHKKDNQQE